MIVIEIFREALSSLWQHKGRTFLSVLGIVIGIGSVIAMMAIGSGSQAQITNAIEDMGTNLVTLSPRGFRSLTMRDLDIILANDYAGIITAVSPELSSSQTLVANDTQETVTVTGVTPTYLQVRSGEIEWGSFWDERQSQQRITALGHTTAETFFGNSSQAIGQKIKIGNFYFTVVAVFKAGGGSGLMDPDNFALIPLDIMQTDIVGSKTLSSIAFATVDDSTVEQAKSIIGYTMLDRHGLESVADADFSMFAATDLLETLTTITQTMTWLLASIAGISLLVGGIGIMNVMLMSVMERTREIGLRKALGAKQRYLIMQFLFEAILITLTGGLIGLLLGLSISWLFALFTSIPASATLTSILTALGISTAVGLIFGIYPARKAAKLEPIEALRTD